jgi:terminase small subunit-like protein
MNTYPSPEAKFAAMPDEALFKIEWFLEGEGDALKAEKAKRKKRIDDEKAQLEQERMERIRQRKDSITYSDELAQEICERIAVGELLLNICDDEHLPTMRRTNQWMRDRPEFLQLYQSAINDRLSIFEEEVIKIADDMTHDFKTIIKNGREKRVPDPEMVARARLRIEVRFKHLKAGRPQKWGDVSTLNVKNQDEFDPASFSAEELEKQIADIENKSRPSRAA